VGRCAVAFGFLAAGDISIIAIPFAVENTSFSGRAVLSDGSDLLAMTKVGKLATHTMRHSRRSWLDAVGTLVAV